MNLDEIEASLPWGLHDAYLERMAIDWIERRLTLDVRVMITEHQDMDQLARITVTGLVYCSIDPPEIDPARGYEPCPSTGLWIDAGSGAANEGDRARMPATPPGCFLHWLFVQGWNRCIHVCARDAELSWIEPHPVAARAETRALFPGDEIPDPGGGSSS
ncbi:MAG: hypothetical protein HY898_23010 [Deltaproteobacteria bacterium]|nr:hypothetical protein [Deltaproteobacteria bacterium]